MLVIIIGAIALPLILTGIWHEEKLIAFEDWLADRIGYIIAKTYLKVKKMRIKRLVKRTEALIKRVGK